MNIFIDIETIPQQPEDAAKTTIAATIQAPGNMSKPETIAAWHAGEGQYAGVKDALIEETYRKTALDGAKGQICSVAFCTDDSEVFCITSNSGDEKYILTELRGEILEILGGKSPWFIGHNIGGFDLKFLFHRFVINRIDPKFDLKQWGRHGSQFYDTMTAWAGYGNRISQANLCAALGINGKPDDIDGSNVWDFYKAGNIERIAEYNRGDVLHVREIYRRLSFNH